jgi:hypothetical protein
MATTLKQTAKRTVLLLATVLLGVAVAAAQRNSDKEDANLRSVQGVVTEVDGRTPVARAIVQLKDMRTLQIRSFVAQAEGTYHFAGLRADTDYEVRATLGEQQSSTKRVSSFDSRKTAIVNLELGKK